jgi:hypothetical protein
MVMALAGLRMSWDEMRQIVRNPNTDQPIAKATFARVFRRELAEGGARLKQLISSKYYEALREGRDWAIRAGLRNRFNWVFEGSQPLPAEAIGSFADSPEMKIEFVMPDKQPEPVDITPPTASPYEGQQPDMSRPAIEGPRPRQHTDYGIVEEPRHEHQNIDPDWPWPHLPKPVGPGHVDNTKGGGSIPPSIFGARGGKTDWMK